MEKALSSKKSKPRILIATDFEELAAKDIQTADTLNISLKDLKIKKDYLIACIGRGRKVIIPNGNDHIEVGDNVVVVTTNKGLDDIADILA